MRSMLMGFIWSEVPGVFLVYLLIITVPTVLAWIGTTWLVKKYDERIACSHAVLVSIVAFLIYFRTLARMPEGGHNYLPWQVFCSGSAMVVLAAAAVICAPIPTLNLLSTWWVTIAGYALCWNTIAGTDGTTGLWGVSLIFLLLGLITGVDVVVWLTLAIRRFLLDFAA